MNLMGLADGRGEWGRPHASMTAHLYLWGARLDSRHARKHLDARRRKIGRLRRIRPPWRLAS